MSTYITITLAGALTALTLSTALVQGQKPPAKPAAPAAAKEDPMQLGNFCVCLTVKDIHASKAFYEKLDFEQVSGDIAQNYVVLKNGTTKIGLFQGMFPRNMLCFNPGWNDKKETLTDFQDVRELQRILKERGIALESEAEEGDGPAYFTLSDPDGNPILFDQHVPRPKK